MLRTYLLLRPAPGSLEALVSYYRDHDVIGAAVPYGRKLANWPTPRRTPLPLPSFPYGPRRRATPDG
jgi:hypothetical protein